MTGRDVGGVTDGGGLRVATRAPSFLAGGGEIGALMRNHDWSASPLGAPETWRPSLRSTVGLMLAAPAQIVLFWGAEYVALYNGAYASTIGAKHPRALGRPAAENWAELWDDLEPLLRSVRETGEPVVAKDRPFFIERNGYPETVYFDIAYSAVPGEDGAVAGVLCVVGETTERVRAEAALRESEAAVRAFFETADIYKAIVDLGDDDFSFVLANRRMAGFWGRDALDGRSARELTGRPVLPAVMKTLRKGHAAGGPTTVEYPYASETGERWFVATLNPLPPGASGKPRLSIASLDITQRKAAEAALAAQEEQFRTLANAMPQLCWIANADGYITWYNNRWYDYTGTTPAQMEGWGWQSVHEPEVLPQVMERWPASIASGTPFEMVFPLKGADGRFRAFLTRVEPLKDASGRVMRWVGTNTDIQAVKDTETALAEALETRDVLLHEVNHRVKNSLQLVTSLLMLQAGQTKDPALRQSLMEARGRIGVVAAMHQRLYSTSQHDRVDFGDYLSDMAAETLQSLDGSGRIALRAEVEAGVIVMLTKAVPLALVVSELVTNAVKYAFPDGRAGRLTVSLARTEGGVTIEVADDGAGLPEGFEPGRSGGLGMKIVTALARQVRGRVVVERREPGTAFRIIVPLTQPAEGR